MGVTQGARDLMRPACGYTQAIPAAVTDDPWPVCPNDQRPLVTA